MGRPNLSVFGGGASQTGLATAREFPGLTIRPNSETFTQLYHKVKNEECSLTLPVWNSHGGEIIESKGLQMLFQQEAILHRLWPGSIKWEVITRKGLKPSGLEVLGVKAAEAQCSQIIADHGWKFVTAKNSPEGYREFHNGKGDFAIIAPGQNVDGYPVQVSKAENPLNFTTFALLACRSSSEWTKREWQGLTKAFSKTQEEIYYFGIEVPLSIDTEVRGEEIQEVLDEISSGIDHLNEIPKVLFVARRSSDTLGFLMESVTEEVPDFLSDSGRKDRIKIVPQIGRSNQLYLPRVDSLFEGLGIADSIKADFLVHKGTQTCFFACPPLELLTHGYEFEAVEKTFRVVLSHYFDLIDNGQIQVTQAQSDFFTKHVHHYRRLGQNAFHFQSII